MVARQRRVRPGRVYVPERGDAIWLAFDPRVGHEQAGRRPAVVLSPRSYNARVGLALVCPITSSVKGYPFEVLLPERGPVKGAVLADQVKFVDWRGRRAQRLAALPPPIIEQVIARIELLLRG